MKTIESIGPTTDAWENTSTVILTPPIWNELRIGERIEEGFRDKTAASRHETPPSDAANCADELLQMYVIELNHIPLLSASTEKVMERQIEVARYIDRLEQEFLDTWRVEPSASDLAVHLARKLYRSISLLDRLGDVLSISPSDSVPSLLYNADLRRAIGGRLYRPLVKRCTPRKGGASLKSTKKELIELSLIASVLPRWLVRMLSDQEFFTDPKVHFQADIVMASHHGEIQSHLEKLKIDGRLAETRLIQSNLRIVIPIAQEYEDQDLDILDLIQDGNIGLVQAARVFDHRRGYRFETHARRLIRQAIEESLWQQNHQLCSSDKSLAQADGRPSAQGSDIIPMESSGMMNPKGGVRYPQGISWRSGGGLDGDDLVACTPQDQIGDMLGDLGNRERLVLTLRFGIDGVGIHNQREIGQILGISTSRAGWIERKALRKLRAFEFNNALAEK